MLLSSRTGGWRQALSVGIRVTAAPVAEGRSNLGVRLLDDEVVEAALIAAGSIADEIPAGLALAERANGRLAAVTAAKAFRQHSRPPSPPCRAIAARAILASTAHLLPPGSGWTTSRFLFHSCHWSNA
jgi:hypothetical protein